MRDIISYLFALLIPPIYCMTNDERYDIIGNIKLEAENGLILSTKQVETLTQCAILCVEHSICENANLEKLVDEDDQWRCSLIEGNIVWGTGDLSVVNDWLLLSKYTVFLFVESYCFSLF